MNTEIETAIKSLYQLIMTVDAGDRTCRVIDRNTELQELVTTTVYDDFCESLYRNIHPADREGFLSFFGPDCFPRELTEQVFVSYSCRIRHAGGGYFWSSLIYCHASQVDATVGHKYVFMVQDIHDTRMRELREELEQRMALRDLQDRYEKLFEENMRDEQTGCYNRKGLKYYTDIILDNARRTGNHLFVCVADLNGLKHLNDTYGHAAGDEAIAAVSKELLRSAPQGSRIVRTGGDEFLLMAALLADSKEPEEMGAKIDAGMDAYNREMQHPFTVGVSYGYVFLPMQPDMTDLDAYIETADARMYAMRLERDEFRRD
ncbi:MAG: GGDEF domain-containing protein [Lachnospiraceae bacterium]|nr:GGDEF domain-containing protein [Lachnospiraceae bacterium]